MLWTWRWIGGGEEEIEAPDRASAHRAAVEMGIRLGTRGTTLAPDPPTLQIKLLRSSAKLDPL